MVPPQPWGESKPRASERGLAAVVFAGRHGGRGLGLIGRWVPGSGYSLALNLPFPPTSGNAPHLAAIAVEAARDVDGVALDYSPASLARVEAILKREGVE